MDYEKKYNEALERASHIKDNNTVATPQEVAEHIFPELRESEDERIRKEIIEHIKDQIDSFISAPDCRDKYEEEELTRYKSWIVYLEKQKEQNHDGKKWIYEDDYHKDMERCFNDGKDEVLENPEKYGLQKERKPAEWSEEDEDAIQQAILALEDRYDEHEPNLHFLGYKLPFNKAAERLKSLRPSWKPSEEQMKVLDEAFMKSDNEKYRQAISSLYYDLQKL